MGSLLLIDDDETFLNELAAKVEALLRDDRVTVGRWVPKQGIEARSAFSEIVGSDTVLVVTDYDLTRNGQTGLFGPSIVDWSQSRFIPVGDFSRGNAGALPKEPNLFEIRVPTGATAASYIAEVYRGFAEVSKRLSSDQSLMEMGSPSAILAGILGVPGAESDFALYGLRLGTASSALMGKMSGTNLEEVDKQAMLSYVLGHLLLNAVLRFPGPILSSRALAAYSGVDVSEKEQLYEFFAPATYDGPFSGLDKYFWLSRVDEVLSKPIEELPENFSADTQGEFNRAAIERHLGRELKRHGCNRCNGKNGGFICPFTARTVCIRQDCSVGTNSWIPQGATLCRIEHDFYEEWAPILGF